MFLKKLDRRRVAYWNQAYHVCVKFVLTLSDPTSPSFFFPTPCILPCTRPGSMIATDLLYTTTATNTNTAGHVWPMAGRSWGSTSSLKLWSPGGKEDSEETIPYGQAWTRESNSKHKSKSKSKSTSGGPPQRSSGWRR